MAKEPSNASKSKQNKFSIATIAIVAVGLIGLMILAVILVSRDNGRRVAHTVAEPVSLEQAEEYYRTGRHEQAVPALEGWLARTGRDNSSVPLARDLLVSSYWKTGNHQKAFDLLQEVVKAKPNDTDSLYRLGLLAAEMEQGETAIEYFAQATSGRPGQPQYHTGYAETLAKLNRYEEAREQWEIVRSLTPADAPQQVELHARIGDMYMAQNLTGPAAAEFKAGLKLDPDNQYLNLKLDLVGR